MHYAIMIASKNREDILSVMEPFQENGDGDCPEQYLEFVIEDHREQFETRTMAQWFAYGRKKPIPISAIQNFPSGDLYKKDVKISEVYESYGEFAKEYHSCKEYNGHYGRWVNPNGRWDYYKIGGRYENRLPLVQLGLFAEKCNTAKKEHIDWPTLWRGQMLYLHEQWDLRQKWAKRKDTESPASKFEFVSDFGFFTSKKLFECKTRQEWITFNTPLPPPCYGFVDDDEWVERESFDDLGYRRQFHQWLHDVPENWYISILDIHR